MDPNELEFMRRAIEEARRSVSEDKRPHPKVGVVVVKNGELLATSYRGEGGHAEYFVLESRLRDQVLAGATVYTTWEPCTSRKHPKISCAQSLIERRVARVVIGAFDPDPELVGTGAKLLEEANIATSRFPDDLVDIILDINREYIRARDQSRLRGISRLTQLARRGWVTWSGAEKPDFLVDGVRFIALIVLGWAIVKALSSLGISSVFDYRWLLAGSAVIVYVHIFVYPFIRKSKKWDTESNRRNLALTAAHDAITACIRKEMSSVRLLNIEEHALAAIKSYVEFAVSDRDGNNFCVSLIVKHPHLEDRPVCIRQTDSVRLGGSIVDVDMARVLRTIETNKTFYDADSGREGKPYRMVWLIPIRSTHSKDPACVGLISVDSSRPRHLDLVDDRKSLIVNLAPYLSLLELALAGRYEYNIWDPFE